MPDYDIETLVPHRRPLRLIDDVIAVDGDAAETVAVVTPDWPTYAAGAVDALVMIELVAQTAAVIGGYKALTSSSANRPRKGMLVGVKKAEFQVDVLPRGTRIVTHATTRPLLENFKEINGIVKVDGEIVGTISLQGVQSA